MVRLRNFFESCALIFSYKVLCGNSLSEQTNYGHLVRIGYYASLYCNSEQCIWIAALPNTSLGAP